MDLLKNCGNFDHIPSSYDTLGVEKAMKCALLYASCFDVRGGFFGTNLTEEDAVISDELNHASYCAGDDLRREAGCRICKANGGKGTYVVALFIAE